MEKTNKYNFLKFTIILILLAFMAYLLFYLTFGSVSDNINHISSFASNLKHISLSASIILSIISLYLISKKNSYKIKTKIKDKYIFIISIILSGVYILLFSKFLPFSPSHDANTIYKAIQSNGVLTGELQNYFNFYVINKLVMYIYLLFSRLIGDVTLSIKILNFLLLYGTCIFSTLSVRTLFEKANKYITLLIITIFLPYGLLTFPYVYQITIFLTSLILYLYTQNKVHTKIFAIILSSILFILRPTTLIVLLVLIFSYALYEFINKKKYLIRILDIAYVLLVSIIIKFLLGQVLYVNKLIPYPNLDNPLRVWTQFVGTRYDYNDSKDTGLWKNAPSYYVEKDVIGEGFTKLWNNIGSDSFTYSDYKTVENELNKKILQRFKYSVLIDPLTIMDYAKNKFDNLYINTLSLYLYNPIIYNDTLMDELEHNYQEKYNLLYNSYLYTFALCTIIYLINIIIKIIKTGYKLEKEDYINLAFLFTVFITTIMYVALLEVSKRYTLDFYIPMLLFTSYQISNIFNRVELKINNIKFNKKYIIILAIFLLSILSCYKIINLNNNTYFTNAEYKISDDVGNKQILHLYLDKIKEGDSIIFYNADNKKYKVKSGVWNDIPFYNNPNGGVALIMIYNESQYIQIKQYSNIDNISE